MVTAMAWETKQVPPVPTEQLIPSDTKSPCVSRKVDIGYSDVLFTPAPSMIAVICSQYCEQMNPLSGKFRSEHF
jgi:hypothetical protein